MDSGKIYNLKDECDGALERYMQFGTDSFEPTLRIYFYPHSYDEVGCVAGESFKTVTGKWSENIKEDLSAAAKCADALNEVNGRLKTCSAELEQIEQTLARVRGEVGL